MTTNDGGPAFPLPIGAEAAGLNCNGMSIRDWFAGMALQGMCVGVVGKIGDGGRVEITAYSHGACNAVLTERAYALADAMLAAREATR
jgi:hypothetical protein